MTVDLATTPAVAVNDENTIYKSGLARPDASTTCGSTSTRTRAPQLRAPRDQVGRRRGVQLDTYPITFADSAGARRRPPTSSVTTDARTAGTEREIANACRSAAASTRSTGTAPTQASSCRTARTGCTSSMSNGSGDRLGALHRSGAPRAPACRRRRATSCRSPRRACSTPAPARAATSSPLDAAGVHRARRHRRRWRAGDRRDRRGDERHGRRPDRRGLHHRLAVGRDAARLVVEPQLRARPDGARTW